jgi:hypothetical protein
MASKKVVLEGIAMWAKIFETNRDLEGYKGAYKDTDGRTSIDLILDKENMEKLNRSGSMKRGKPDPEGRGTMVKVDRKFNTGRDWDSGAPEVLRADGNPWDVNTDGFVGNGSKVRVMVVVTDFPDKGVTSTRLEMVKILEHVPHEGVADSFRKDESVNGTTPKATPSPEVSKESQPKPKVVLADVEDDIPF